MNIRGSIQVMSSLLGAGKATEVGSASSAADAREYESLRSRVNEVLVIPGFNGPIVLVYDKKSGAYRLL